MKRPCVYMLASQRNGTLYIGVSSNLQARIWQHKNNGVCALRAAGLNAGLRTGGRGTFFIPAAARSGKFRSQT